MRIIITGGSGFIGQHLANNLLTKGHEVIIWDLKTPEEKSDYVEINLVEHEPRPELFEGVDAIIHLLGKNIFGRWTDDLKQQIYDSRIKSTRNLVTALSKLEQRPRVLISASAAGYYGDREEEELTEEAGPGEDFLSTVAKDWEEEARKADALGMRTVQIRTALVLGPQGLLGKLVPLYTFFIGGPLGSGNQWFPWIHLQDIVGIYTFALEQKTLQGPVNAAAPENVRNKEFSKVLARTLNRPSFFHIPSFALHVLYNEFAGAIMASQKVSSKKLIEAGYKFQYPNLQKALHQVINNK